MIPPNPVISENSAPLSSTIQDNLPSPRLEPVAPTVEKKDISNRITHVIQKKYQPKLKYRNSASRRLFIEKRARKTLRFFIHLDVVELKTRDFDCATRLKDFELFNLIIA